MQFDIKNDILMERENHSKEWTPVPVYRLEEAIREVSKKGKKHSVSTSGNLKIKVL